MYIATPEQPASYLFITCTSHLNHTRPQNAPHATHKFRVLLLNARTQPSFDQTDDGVDAETFLSFSLSSCLSLFSAFILFSRAPIGSICSLWKMRVSSKELFSTLKNLPGLDQSSFQLAKKLLSLTELYQRTQQRLTFLYRCKTNNIFPNFILRNTQLPRNLPPSTSIQRINDKYRRQLLAHYIRDSHQQLQTAQRTINVTTSATPPQLLQRIDHILTTATSSTRLLHQTSLTRKFDRLSYQQLPQCEQLAPCTSADTNRPPNNNPSDKITIIGNIDIPKPALTALAKGPNFTIAPRTTKASLQHQVQIETAALANAIRWKHATSPTAQATATSANHPRTSSANKFDDINKICPFHNYRKEPPRATKDIERTILTTAQRPTTTRQTHNPTLHYFQHHPIRARSHHETTRHG